MRPIQDKSTYTEMVSQSPPELAGYSAGSNRTNPGAIHKGRIELVSFGYQGPSHVDWHGVPVGGICVSYD